jgi:hypothetical protein
MIFDFGKIEQTLFKSSTSSFFKPRAITEENHRGFLHSIEVVIGFHHHGHLHILTFLIFFHHFTHHHFLFWRSNVWLSWLKCSGEDFADYTAVSGATDRNETSENGEANFAAKHTFLITLMESILSFTVLRRAMYDLTIASIFKSNIVTFLFKRTFTIPLAISSVLELRSFNIFLSLGYDIFICCIVFLLSGGSLFLLYCVLGISYNGQGAQGENNEFEHHIFFFYLYNINELNIKIFRKIIKNFYDN